ncbi:MAG TPA: Holliday junction resolvase RuvX [Patescibacteria group bacterium]|nr:Holliday junction resolvase RuvX [Patescibacteria group bacterium]
MRILAVDPGTKWIGLAISDPSGTVAHGLDTLAAEPAGTLGARLGGVARQHEATRVVVGLPRRLDGSYGPEAAAARRLAEQIREESGLPVELVDERMTTAQAQRALIAGGVSRAERRLTVDRVAATLLLQGHLDRRKARAVRAVRKGVD